MKKYTYPREGRQGFTRIQISKGNTKLGNIPGFALLPGITCRQDVPCKKSCYAVKYLKRYPKAVEAYQHNTKLMTDNHATRLKAFTDIMAYLKKWNPSYFRVHVAGDFIDQHYLDLWFQVARENPDTRFMAYTKKHELNFSEKPANFNLYLSVWGKITSSKVISGGLPLALTIDMPETESRYYAGDFICKGKCQECMHCYSRKPENVVLKLK